MNRSAFGLFIASDLSKNRPGLWLIDPGGFGVRHIVIKTTRLPDFFAQRRGIPSIEGISRKASATWKRFGETIYNLA